MDFNSAVFNQKTTSPPSPELVDLTDQLDTVCASAVKVEVNKNEESTSVEQEAFLRPIYAAAFSVGLSTTCPNYKTESDSINKELEKLQNELKVANETILEAADIMKEQMKAVEAAEQKQQELDTLLTQEKNKRISAEDKFEKQCEFTEQVNGEISEHIKELQTLVQNLQTTVDARLVSSRQKPQGKHSIKMQLENLMKLAEKLMMVVGQNGEKRDDSKSTECKGREQSNDLSFVEEKMCESEKHPSSSNVETFPSHDSKADKCKSKVIHEWNEKKRRQGYFCLCGKEYISMTRLNKHVNRHFFVKLRVTKVTGSERFLENAQVIPPTLPAEDNADQSTGKPKPKTSERLQERKKKRNTSKAKSNKAKRVLKNSKKEGKHTFDNPLKRRCSERLKRKKQPSPIEPSNEKAELSTSPALRLDNGNNPIAEAIVKRTERTMTLDNLPSIAYIANHCLQEDEMSTCSIDKNSQVSSDVEDDDVDIEGCFVLDPNWYAGPTTHQAGEKSENVRMEEESFFPEKGF